MLQIYRSLRWFGLVRLSPLPIFLWTGFLMIETCSQDCCNNPNYKPMSILKQPIPLIVNSQTQDDGRYDQRPNPKDYIDGSVDDSHRIGFDNGYSGKAYGNEYTGGGYGNEFTGGGYGNSIRGNGDGYTGSDLMGHSDDDWPPTGLNQPPYPYMDQLPFQLPPIYYAPPLKPLKRPQITPPPPPPPSKFEGGRYGHLEDMALFLVVLTIAGLFGLIIAMFIPFILLLQSQGSVVGANGQFVPGTAGTAIPGQVVGRRRKRSFTQTMEILQSIHNSSIKYQD